MSRRRQAGLAFLALLVLSLLLVAQRCSPMWPGPALPIGATPLRILTAQPNFLPAMGCPAALLLPVRVGVEGDAMTFTSVDTGERTRVVWPAGWKAWIRDGRAELVRRDGTVVGRDGDALEGFGGGSGDVRGFTVCIPGH